MGVRKKPRTNNPAEQGRLTGRTRPPGKTGMINGHRINLTAARTLTGFRMTRNDWRDWKKN